MAVDIAQIQLTDAERRMLAEASERTGKPWAQVLQEALRHYGAGVELAAAGNGDDAETVHLAMKRSGLLGCLKECPPDLSTNPDYMEGFGEGDR